MKPIVIPLFIPNAGCPDICVFCNQKLIAGKTEIPGEAEIDRVVSLYVESEKTKKSKNSSSSPHPSTHKSKSLYKAKKTGNLLIRTSLGIPSYSDKIREIAFYGGSFTGLDVDTQETLLHAAEKWIKQGTVKGIRLSTRPDLINCKILGMLKKWRVTTIELGAQSFSSVVLKASGRGHEPEATIKAAGLIKKNGFRLGIQLMMGLPGDSEEVFVESVKKTISLNPQFARVYPAVILPGTKLMEMHETGNYIPLSLEQTVELGARALDFFYSAGIPVIRFGLPEEQGKGRGIRIGPAHPALKHLVDSRLAYVRMCAEISKTGAGIKGVSFVVPPAEVSVFRGLKKENIEKIEKTFGINCEIIPE